MLVCYTYEFSPLPLLAGATGATVQFLFAGETNYDALPLFRTKTSGGVYTIHVVFVQILLQRAGLKGSRPCSIECACTAA